jgi:hypothetical protein
MPLVDISRAKIIEYRKKSGVDGGGFITISREISFLRKLLKLPLGTSDYRKLSPVQGTPAR